MNSIAAVVTWSGDSQESATLRALHECESIGEIALASSTPSAALPSGSYKTFGISTQWSKSSVVEIVRWFEATRAEYLVWILSGAPLLSPSGMARLVGCARDADAAIAYGDYQDLRADGTLSLHPLIDYQSGSLRDDFDFGSVVLLSAGKLSGLAGEVQEASPELQYGGWYDLRLRLSERGSVLHLSEPIYRMPVKEERSSGERVFDYVDPRKADYQLEMEEVATDHLKRIGALLEPPGEEPLSDEALYPVEASVVIPVKNRERTIADAVRSALSQKTSFDFNVIVIDNHSRDGTTRILEDISARDERLVHRIPERRDLLIGGCWNEAVTSELCGRIAVQLDSDDLYAGIDVLERMVGAFRQKPFALVIGSYTTVDFDLQPLPPGLIDHREWTESNGHNNALRIAGLGAPRAFHVPTLRSLRFPNVSYGEDYAVALRLCRSYRVGRIYDSLYWCRRWEENSDSALSLETANRYASYKDSLRSIEISARRRQKEERQAQ
jgi:hypothetical protein